MSDDRLNQLDYYTLLGLEPGASGDDIKAAFRTFARRYHPDRFTAAPPAKRIRAAQIYRRGAEGYGVLSDPQKRRRYDAGLSAGQLRYAPPTGKRADAGATERAPLPMKARPFATKAKQAIKRGDFQTARLNLQIALGHAPGHPELEEQMRQVRAALGK